jgi:hypothetical protein
MPYAPEDIRPHIGDRVHKDVSTTGTDDYLHVTRWIIQAGYHLQRINDWTCHKQEFSLTLTAGTYAYAYTDTVWDGAALVRPRKLQVDSIRRVNSNKRLIWRDEAEEIDRDLGGNWKDSASANTVSDYASLRGNSLIIAGKPSSDYVSSHPTLEGYYYRGEDFDSSGGDWETTDFAFHSDFFMDHVDLCIIFGMQQEDESEFRTMLAHWDRTRLPELRGYDPTPHSDEQIHVVDWYGAVEGESYIY